MGCRDYNYQGSSGSDKGSFHYMGDPKTDHNIL